MRKAGDLARLNEVLDGIRESLGKEWLKSVLGDSCRDSSGRTALDYACSAQNVEIAKVLIESGADFKTSALMAASTNNTIRKPIGFLQSDKVTILSDSNPRASLVGLRNDDGSVILPFARKSVDRVVEGTVIAGHSTLDGDGNLLLGVEKQKLGTLQAGDGRTVLSDDGVVLGKRRVDGTIITTLLSGVSWKDVVAPESWVVENDAVVINDHSYGCLTLILEKLREKKALSKQLINRRDTKTGWTALMFAMQGFPSTEPVQMLLDAGADVGMVVDEAGFTPLIYASRRTSPILLKMCLLRLEGLDNQTKSDALDHTDTRGCTALIHSAAEERAHKSTSSSAPRRTSASRPPRRNTRR